MDRHYSQSRFTAVNAINVMDRSGNNSSDLVSVHNAVIGKGIKLKSTIIMHTLLYIKNHKCINYNQL